MKVVCLLVLLLVAATMAAPAAVPAAQPAQAAQSAAAAAQAVAEQELILHEERRSDDLYNEWYGGAPLPGYVGYADMAIYLNWNISEGPVGMGAGYDLDNIIQIPNGCIVSAKDTSNGGECDADNGYGFTSLGGMRSNINIVYGTSPNTLDYPSADSYYGGAHPGIEVLWLNNVDVGIYNHLVYQNMDVGNDGTGFVYVRQAMVRVFVVGPDGYSPNNIHSDDVVSAYKRNSCYGRFWNTFRVNITQSDPLEFSFIEVQTITSTPETAFGTTDTLALEGTNSRDNSGC